MLLRHVGICLFLWAGCGGEQRLVGGRAYELYAPDNALHAGPLPLVVLLHGYGATGARENLYLGFSGVVDERHFLLAVPDGTPDHKNKRMWNATDACCDFDGQRVDDVAFVNDLMNDVGRRYAVDVNRIYVVGHSNGGFMALRLACELSERVAAVVSLAGAAWLDEHRCPAGARPVSILHIHGTDDHTIEYGGGIQPDSHNEYPGALGTVDRFARHNACSPDRVRADGLNLDFSLPGAETEVLRQARCPAQGDVELWTINGGAHIPKFSRAFRDHVLDWLLAHAR